MSTWEEVRKRRSPTFLFWDSIIEYETLVLLAVRAQRQHNFNLYVEALGDLIPLFFALDHQGHWVLSKTGNRFSAIPFDQAHEQQNKVIKSAGGAVGLTENPVAFR